MNQATATKPSICANSELKAAKFKLRKFRDETTFSGREVLLTEAAYHLHNVFESGTPIEKRKATPLDATVDLETVKFWVKQPDFGTELSLLKGATERLRNVLVNGTPAEKRKATRLDVTVDLVTANFWVREPDFGTQPSLLRGATERLRNVLKNGTPAEKREATRLKATIESK